MLLPGWELRAGAHGVSVSGQASSASTPHAELDLHPEEGLEVLIGHMLLQGSQGPLPAVLVVLQQCLRIIHPHAVGAAAHAAVCGGLQLRGRGVTGF